jgi:hypothetical protein
VLCAALIQVANLSAAGHALTVKALHEVRVGDNEREVTSLLGSGYEVCIACGRDLTWLYEFRGETGRGTAIRFAHGRVVAIVSLGAPVATRSRLALPPPMG